MAFFRGFAKNVTTILGFNKGIAVSKESTAGILIDLDSPNFGWTDLKGVRVVDDRGLNAPTIETYRGGVEDYAYNASDFQLWNSHLDHWNVAGGEKYIHAHIRHNGTAITGDLVLTFEICFNFGHGRSGSPAPITKTLTVPSATVETYAQYGTYISDILIAQSGGGAGLFDSDDWLPDDDILVKMTVTTLPTITGGTTAKLFIPYVDFHMQSTGLNTKNRAPNFYT